MSRWSPALRAFIILLVLGGCGPISVLRPTDPTPTALGTFTPIPTFTPTSPALDAPTIVPTPVSIPTQPPATASGTLYVTVTADNVNLRTRPGTVFPVSRLLAKGTRLQLLGHAPGNEWLYVKTDSNVQGWILFWLVTGGHDGGQTPEVTPGDVLVVHGKVLDRAGVPISGVGYAVTQGTGSGAPRTDANTDETGQFYAFLPATATGTWIVSYVAISCKCNTMDANCNCIGNCGTSDPPSITISMPPQGVLEFVWR